jgi:hypothetical protein
VIGDKLMIKKVQVLIPHRSGGRRLPGVMRRNSTGTTIAISCTASPPHPAAVHISQIHGDSVHV